MGGSDDGASWRGRYGTFALVTGASEGIGRAVAEELGARGLNLVLVARRQAQLEEVARAIEAQHGVSVRVLPADLADRAAVEHVLAEVAAIDIGLFVAAAGFGTSGRFLDNPAESEADMLDVNCRAVLVMTHAMAARFVARGRGGIVLLSSIVAFQGVPHAANYSATKAYVQTLAEGLGPELGPLGVDVLAVIPGPVRSGFAGRAGMRMSQAADPAEIARASIASLGRRSSVRPGRLSKLLGGSLSLLPRSGRTLVMGRIMAGMTKHRQNADA